MILRSIFFLFFIMAMNVNAQEFTKNQLIGKGNALLIKENMYLQPEAYKAFLRMQEDAKKKNIHIKIVSGYRDFEKQKNIWKRKYERYISQGLIPEQAIQKIIEYSTIPGTSRHHWGTDIDIIDENATYSGDVLVPEKFHGNGPFCKLKEWLDKNANKYGFYIVYTNNANRKGFKYEPWHYSYAPVSKKMLKAYKGLSLKEILLEEKLPGIEYFTDGFLNNYILQNISDINPALF
ncbi:M15 family metallopeptidase [Abyssalbus ytuae]|uniref:M15 family metallopeptidase n=1 Tax=Abyssalbus ytuae TaxID=2926907 RepID=A0A9E7CUF7_9FLAO|nr:M15 family metallopeptidase [Abyssalbus ytuae]UOB18342.1 M15 family metallopeptidase [Abyssalbus ytuae]